MSTPLAHQMGMRSEDAGLLGDAIGVPVFWAFGAIAMDDLDPASLAPGRMPLLRDGRPPAANHSPHFAPDARGAVVTGTRAALSGILHFVGRR